MVNPMRCSTSERPEYTFARISYSVPRIKPSTKHPAEKPFAARLQTTQQISVVSAGLAQALWSKNNRTETEASNSLKQKGLGEFK